MVGYTQARNTAKGFRNDWNEREYIAKATITWADSEYEYELEIENEDLMDDSDFAEWIEQNAEDLAREDAEESRTYFESIERISYETEYINDDELFEDEYNTACESEWESGTGR